MKLLVSVISVEEAEQAVEGGADIIDVKDPSEGSLGAQHPLVVQAIRQVVPHTVEVSATLGDFPFLPNSAAQATYALASMGVDYVKVGLLGCRNRQNVNRMAQALCRAAEAFPSVQVVAGCYADYYLVDSVSPWEVVEGVQDTEVAGVLVDTAVKRGQTLFDHLSLEEQQALAELCHSRGLFCALAGSIKAPHIPGLKRTGVDIVGVRGAVCGGDRQAKLRVDLMQELLTLVRQEQVIPAAALV